MDKPPSCASATAFLSRPEASRPDRSGLNRTGAGVVNPLVNTQFQYLDVGVNVDVTPRIHPDHEISMKVNVVVSSQTGSTNIGGINQPIISQRSIEHDIRLKDGEVNVLGGLIEQTDTDTITGIPGLRKDSRLQIFLWSGHRRPRKGRNPDRPDSAHRAIAGDHGREFAQHRFRNGYQRRSAAGRCRAFCLSRSEAAGRAGCRPSGSSRRAGCARAGELRRHRKMRPCVSSLGPPHLKPGETTTIGVIVQNVQDLYSIPMLLQFNPAVISIEDVRQGGFLSGGTQEVAIVERVDKERGQAIISATRMPNTPGVSGSGTLVGIVVKGVAPGNSQLSIVQVNAKDSQQRPIQVVTGEATIKVQ